MALVYPDIFQSLNFPPKILIMEISAKTRSSLRIAAVTLGCAYALFLSIFSADAFSENFSFWQNAFSLFIHLIPTLTVIIILFFAWRWQWVGVVFFSLIGIGYIIWAWARFPLSVYVTIAGPLFLLALLFYLSKENTISAAA